MTTIKIDDVEYDLDKLSDEAKALQTELPAMPASDTIKFN